MRIALGVEYDGTDYAGWQAQESQHTVQSCLETALTKIADAPVKLYCAGRTDAGVHATGQVVHFDTEAVRPLPAWTLGTNAHLAHTISVKWAQEVDENFHARFSAVSRVYRYIICNTPMHSAIYARRATWFRYSLDAERMHIAAQLLLGEHDFSSFRSSACESVSPMRNVQAISVRRVNEFVVLDIEANAFLHHMVRNITGTLLRIGTGQHPAHWLEEVLLARDRRKASETAPAAGLYLRHVNYPDTWDLPVTSTTVFPG